MSPLNRQFQAQPNQVPITKTKFKPVSNFRKSGSSRNTPAPAPPAQPSPVPVAQPAQPGTQRKTQLQIPSPAQPPSSPTQKPVSKRKRVKTFRSNRFGKNFKSKRFWHPNPLTISINPKPLGSWFSVLILGFGNLVLAYGFSLWFWVLVLGLGVSFGVYLTSHTA